MDNAAPQPIITGTPRTVHDLFSNQRYGLEYYQREYNWKRAQVQELLSDLTNAFASQRESGHNQASVAEYNPYFLGPIITTLRDLTYLIDGQQRLTTLSLLLIRLLHLLPLADDLRAKVLLCVYGSKFGVKSFTLDVEERAECMRALRDDQHFDASRSTSSSVRNLSARYQDIEELFDVDEADLCMFVEWLLEKVVLVEIATTDGKMAYEIFETMNDRGLKLAPTDMLKSYLLAQLQDQRQIKTSDDFWRDRVRRLNDTQDNAAGDFFKAWLRSGYATSVGARRRGSARDDWELIGGEFHKWVRSQADNLDFDSSDSVYEFVNHEFDGMSRHYLCLLNAQSRLVDGLEHLRYNAVLGFTLQLTVAMAPVTPDDSDDIALEKMGLVAKYIDGLLARRIVNYNNINYNTLKSTMYSLCRSIRDLELPRLRERLGELWAEQDTFDPVLSYRLHQRNRPRVRYILARMTDFIERQCGNETVFDGLIDRQRKDPFEIEHVWANKPERYRDDFPTDHEFQNARHRFGGLLLLPKSFNASYGALPYADKVRHYRGQNLLLAKSLHPDTYQRNPIFTSFIEDKGLPFEPYPERFTTTEMERRQELYRMLCEYVWPARID